ncbi:hypothetical protein GLOIN_2v1882595 [Rhizophagus irregularis DAOM 181602=DAOM 197198]|uniref:Uncharacterized protein n=1 Tax=Rhizophagus irregularis (strain DAOM 181602 / DAOM 197198 / MUCL 43194) TaxID=747089 RepID=A0A2P4PBQ9_RHIID|nr:hypothetical protein GLOIN_2v1882595 [Rhizophagus irregularis DAOM 181602=DAOM 197198]POG62810.1 hypothetical protein GLOIN_2v1882595 [Rhizophagus irregularis DAOM 181602=DAOM 197198]|eukprot:XP_025169676.1 hypothetical protein GLOIN_2v1882595 [Rhizophagus irregularis DAOM 181602=DAOM 197198]
MGGLASNILQETFSILTTKGEELFLTIWKCFEFPSTWSRQQSPITHLNSYFFSDYLHLTMIMPFLINRAINVNLLKDNFVNNISISYNLRRNQIVDKLCYLWILFAKLIALVFKKTYSKAEIKNLNDLIIQWADLILKIFPSISRLPNFHIIRHFNIHIQNFGPLVNKAVATKEMVHRIFKYLLDGGVDSRYNNTTQFNFKELLKDQCVRNFLDNWYISPLQFDLESDSSLTCMTENYINLCVQSPLKKCDLKKDDLETFLNDDLFAELGRAYEEDLNNIEHLKSRDVVDVLEDITPLGNISQNATDMVTRVSYARIKAIILHQKGQLQVPFLFLDWFISQNTND